MYVKKWQPQTSTFFGVSEGFSWKSSRISSPTPEQFEKLPHLGCHSWCVLQQRWRKGCLHHETDGSTVLYTYIDPIKIDYINIPHMDPMCHRTSKIEPKNEWWEFSRGEIILLLRLVEGVLPFSLMVATWQSTSRGYACISIWYRNARNLRTAFFYI